MTHSHESDSFSKIQDILDYSTIYNESELISAMSNIGKENVQEADQ